MASREEQAKVANRLRTALGSRYDVRFDDCESCLTRVFYRAKNGEMIFVKEVSNTEMKSGISVTDFQLSSEQIHYLMATSNL